jgi:DNA-binding NarL/FixJ family response regulator
MHHLNVLIVDDSELTIRKLTEMLRQLGHSVVDSADSGDAALKSYRIYTPDLVTMDITMPGMDGIEATAKIVAEFPDAKIIMVTSHGQEAMVIKAIKAGAKGYVLKPFKLDKLSEVLNRVVREDV